MPFPIGGPLDGSLYLQSFSRYLAPTNVNEQTNERTNQPTNAKQTRRIALHPGGCNNNNNNTDNNNSTKYNLYGPIIMIEPLWEFTRFKWWMHTEQRQVAAHLWTKPSCRQLGNYRLHLLLIRPKVDIYFTVPQRVEGWVDLGGWLHTDIYIPRCQEKYGMEKGIMGLVPQFFIK